MPDYPVSLNVANRRCVVVGGGEVAARKVAALLAAGARVVVISLDLVPELRQQRDAGRDVPAEPVPSLVETLHATSLQVKGRLYHVARPYRDGDLTQAFLAIAATDDQATNRAVAAEARRRGVLVNVVDDPAACDFTLPAVLRRGDLVVAISTGGRSPAMAAWLREELEDFLTPEYLTLLEVVAEVRAALRARGQRVPAAAWRRALDDALLALARQGDRSRLRAALLARLTER